MEKITEKKPVIRHGRLATFALAVMVFVSCAAGAPAETGGAKRQKLKVMNWNLQTFFDASFDGSEYSEYRNAKGGWTQEKYEARLDRLASVIKTLDADIIILEELEKEAQLQDIANRLSGTFHFSKLYTHALFATSDGSAIGCAVLSRLPIDDVFVHAMDIRGKTRQPSMRPIIQFSVQAKNKTLTIFVNHWKSKSGGAEKSEIWRKRQESQLAALMAQASKKNRPVLAAGDLNKDISEFDVCATENGKNVLLHGAQAVPVYSPWILENGSLVESGSYWYKKEWERIDHFFVAGDITLTDFRPETAGEWAFEDGHPRRYQLWNGKGYSDHLPITCTVIF